MSSVILSDFLGLTDRAGGPKPLLFHVPPAKYSQRFLLKAQASSSSLQSQSSLSFAHSPESFTNHLSLLAFEGICIFCLNPASSLFAQDKDKLS